MVGVMSLRFLGLGFGLAGLIGCEVAGASPEMISPRACGIMAQTIVDDRVEESMKLQAEVKAANATLFVMQDRIDELKEAAETARSEVAARMSSSTSSVAEIVITSSVAVVVTSSVATVRTSSVVVDVTDGAKWVSVGGVVTKVEGVL